MQDKGKFYRAVTLDIFEEFIDAIKFRHYEPGFSVKTRPSHAERKDGSVCEKERRGKAVKILEDVTKSI